MAGAESRTRIVELIAGPGLPNRAQKRSSAVSAAEAALTKGPSPEALEAGLFLAELYSREENYTAAVQMYTKLRDLFPSDPDRLMELATAQRETREREETLRFLSDPNVRYVSLAGLKSSPDASAWLLWNPGTRKGLLLARGLFEGVIELSTIFVFGINGLFHLLNFPVFTLNWCPSNRSNLK